MNKMKFLAIGMGMAVLVTSCRKYDFMETEESNTAASEWKNVGNWTASTEENKTVYTSIISDSNITADVVANGLVLAYLKSGNTTEALPFQGGTSNAAWFHQVSQNSIELNAEVEGKSTAPASQLRYFVITPAQLTSLEQNGHPATELMSLTYDQAATLLK